MHDFLGTTGLTKDLSLLIGTYTGSWGKNAVAKYACQYIYWYFVLVVYGIRYVQYIHKEISFSQPLSHLFLGIMSISDFIDPTTHR